MSYPVAIPASADPVRKEMDDLAEALSKVLHVKVRVNPATFEVDDKNAADTLRTILKYVAVDHPNGKKPAQKSKLTRASWENVETGEIVSSYLLNKMLNTRDPELVNKVFRNRAGVRFVVTDMGEQMKPGEGAAIPKGWDAVITQVQISKIVANPWQPRTSTDEASLQELANSIQRDGLLQPPVARSVDGHYELALGHRRLQACQLLGMEEIPLDLRELTDRQMFELALSENIQRKDLNPVEIAEAEKRYMEEFNATSDECGKFFGKAGATVRGDIRLLELPEDAKTALADGKITVGAARSLVTLQKLAPEKIKNAMKDISTGEAAEEVVNYQLSRNGMEMPWTNNKNIAGTGLWELSMKKFPVQYLPALDEKITENREHLLNPPACSVCPFFAIIKGDRFCGLKECFARKEEAWDQYKVEKVCKKLGISLYQPADGPYLVLESREPSHQKAYESRHADLRLITRKMMREYVWQSFDDVPDDFYVIAVGKSFEELAIAGKTTSHGKKTEAEKAFARAMKLYRQRRKELLWEYSAAAEKLFADVPPEALKKILQWKFVGIDDRLPKEYVPSKESSKVEKNSFQRRELIWSMCFECSSYYQRINLENILERYAAITTVKAPKTLVKLAQGWDAELQATDPVSAETEEEDDLEIIDEEEE